VHKWLSSCCAAWIEQLAAEGITAGCGGGNYCPERATTHAEMAIFLLRSKFTSIYQPSHGTDTRFDDVPESHWAAAWIEEADDVPYGVYGIYTIQELIWDGCQQNYQGYPVRFCLDAPVTRALMAGLMMRTFELPSWDDWFAGLYISAITTRQCHSDAPFFDNVASLETWKAL
jgi:hypothetical protein